MSDYLTPPRRRHSSLFQRMESQIHKISRKLSAAKQHRYSHSHHPALSEEPTTVRKAPIDHISSGYQPTRKRRDSATQLHHQPSYSSRPPARRLRFAPTKQYDQETFASPSQSVQVAQLLQQNRVLQQQLIKMQGVCQEQAFKIGYLGAENKDYGWQLEQVKQAFTRQQLYMSKLLEGYRIKVGKYKKMMNGESVEISLGDLP